MEKTINIFDQYTQLENRLTHALAVTLKRSALFRTAFIKEFAPHSRLEKGFSVTPQLATGKTSSTKNDEISGIPDLALIDKEDRAIIIESKVGSILHHQQLICRQPVSGRWRSHNDPYQPTI